MHNDPLLFGALRRDLQMLYTTAEAWGIPALLICAALLAVLSGHAVRDVGRRAAVALILITVAEPLTTEYHGADICDGSLPPLSAGWFGAMLDQLGITQLCFLAAAGLVLLASRLTPPAAAQAVIPPPGTAWRRLLATLADYLIILAVVLFIGPPVLALVGDHSALFPRLEYGFWNLTTLLSLDLLNLDVLSRSVPLGELLVLPGIFLYFWAQHVRWGQTLGKRLMRIQVVPAAETPPSARRMALRTLIFPILVIEPTVGPFVLIADVTWALFDSQGQGLHDRLAGTHVTRRLTTAQPQTGADPHPPS